MHMALRGDQLREHILWSAKEVFLEKGFERASMDLVAARAQTSKRSLYAHFESKEKLFLAFVDLVRGRFLTRIQSPADYSSKPADALTLFCGRFLEVITYKASIQMCRVCMAEADRFSEGSAQYFNVLFIQVQARLAAYLKKTFRLTPRGAADAAGRLLAQVVYPRFFRALFGVDPLRDGFDADTLSPRFDLRPIRKAVADLLDSLPQP